MSKCFFLLDKMSMGKSQWTGFKVFLKHQILVELQVKRIGNFLLLQKLFPNNTSNIFLCKLCRNNTLGLCQCEDDEWKTFQKGSWSCTMSPYEVRYVDVKVIDATPLSGPVTIAIEEGVYNIGY